MSNDPLFPFPAEWAARTPVEDADAYAAADRSRPSRSGRASRRSIGERLDWMEPFTQVKDVSFEREDSGVRWYGDGMLNACANLPRPPSA